MLALALVALAVVAAVDAAPRALTERASANCTVTVFSQVAAGAPHSHLVIVVTVLNRV
jgi:hypothetical protein